LITNFIDWYKIRLALFGVTFQCKKKKQTKKKQNKSIKENLKKLNNNTNNKIK